MFNVDWTSLGIGGGIIVLVLLIIVVMRKLLRRPEKNKEREAMLQNIVDLARGQPVQQTQTIQKDETKSMIIQLDMNPILDTEKKINTMVLDTQNAVKEIQDNVSKMKTEQKEFITKMYDHVIPLLKEDLEESIKKKKG